MSYVEDVCFHAQRASEEDRRRESAEETLGEVIALEKQLVGERLADQEFRDAEKV